MTLDCRESAGITNLVEVLSGGRYGGFVLSSLDGSYWKRFFKPLPGGLEVGHVYRAAPDLQGAYVFRKVNEYNYNFLVRTSGDAWQTMGNTVCPWGIAYLGVNDGEPFNLVLDTQ